MNRILSLLLAAALIALPGCAYAGKAVVPLEVRPAVAVAQSPASRVARVEIYADKSGEHRWRLIAANGAKIADSAEGYTSRSNARRAVAAVTATLTKAKLVEIGNRKSEIANP